MAFVKFKTIPPYNEVMVNPAEIIAVTPEPTTPENDSELLVDGQRQILVLEAQDAAAQKLGPGFVRFDAASTSYTTVYVNKALVLHLLPHPQVANVVQIHGKVRRIPVKGTLEEVAQKFA